MAHESDRHSFHVFLCEFSVEIMTDGHSPQISSHSNVLLLEILLVSVYYAECYT